MPSPSLSTAARSVGAISAATPPRPMEVDGSELPAPHAVYGLRLHPSPYCERVPALPDWRLSRRGGASMRADGEGPDDRIECDCGARLSPKAIVINENRCPECAKYWEPCPGCYRWLAPFATRNNWRYCPGVDCGLDGEFKTALRVPSDDPRSRTLRELRQDDRTPWDPVANHSDDEIGHEQASTPAAAGGGN
jgi:hypothetical protein